MPKYCIAGLIIDIIAPLWSLHDNFAFFLCDNGDADVNCNIVFQKRTLAPIEESKVLVKTVGTLIYEFQGRIHNLSGDEDDIPSYTIISKDWSSCTMFIGPGYNNPHDNEIVQSVKEGIFTALRHVVIGALAQRQGLLIHSSTIIWDGRGVMFSAPSGTGKSTQAHLWQQLYGTQILDGDVTACRIVNSLPMVYGLPWCGTSGEFINHAVPLGTIVFLQQAKENSIERLSLLDAFLRLAARCYLLPWNDELMNQFLNIVHEIAECTDCYLLNCLPDPDAVELVKNCL